MRLISKHGPYVLFPKFLRQRTLERILVIDQQISKVRVIARFPNLITLSAGTHNGHTLWYAFRPKTTRNNMVAGYLANRTTVRTYTLFDFSGGVRLHLPSVSSTK